MTNFSEKNLSREVQNHKLICLCCAQMKMIIKIPLIMMIMTILMWNSRITNGFLVFSRHDKITKKDKITSEFALSRDCKKSSIAKCAGRKGGEVRVQLSLVIIHYEGEDEEIDEDDIVLNIVELIE